MHSILVVRAGALGDALLTLPALAALRSRWPAAQLTLVAPRALLPFAQASGLADACLPFEGEAGLALSQDGALPAWSRADLAVVWLRQWETVAARLAGAGARTVLGAPSQPAVGEPTHVADHLLLTLAPLGVGLSRLARPLIPPPHAAEQAEQPRQMAPVGAPIYAIHPGSGGPAKCWPEERYQRLIARLTGDGATTVLICLGPVEHERAEVWQEFAAQRRRVTCLFAAPLPVLAAVLQRCAAFVGNDAGVTHLAAALGVPTLALFGPTDPARWAPLGPRVRVLRDPAWTAWTIGTQSEGARWSLSVEAVAAAVLAMDTPPAH